MFGIAQCGENIHYLHWVPSESGPLITHFNSTHVNGGINFADINSIKQIFEPLKQIANNYPIPVSLSIDISQVKLFQLRIDNEEPSSLIDWHFSQASENKLSDKFESFQYRMHSSSNSLIGLSIPTSTKNNILKVASQFNCNLNGFSCGIFSAEQGVRQWYHTSQLKSYIIWKIGKRNVDHILYIKDGELVSYFTTRRTEKNVRLLQVIGSQEDADLVINNINDVIKSEKSKFGCAEKVFVYQCDKRQKEVRELMDLVIENLVLLNPFSVLEMESDKKVNDFSSLPFAEAGVAFRGIDV